jgi:predicted dehydrogenase
MTQPFRWGLVGPGRIAHRFAEAVQRLPDARLAVVFARDAGRGAAFVARWPDPEGRPAELAGSLDALLAPGTVDAVYVATPHPSHAPIAHRLLEAGVPVLCEKPMTVSAAATAALIQAARQHRVLLMEAVWTRFLPVYQEVAGWLRDGRIGALRQLRSSFAFNLPLDPASRLFDPALGGGVLLDIGVYNLHVTRWVLQQAHGSVPELRGLHASGTLAPTGVDLRVASQLDFDDGAVAQFVCAFDGQAPNAFEILGERGVIELPWGFWQATEAHLRAAGEAPVRIERPFAVNGFEGQIEEAMRCVRSGAVESAVIPHAESLAVARWVDELRARVGAPDFGS